MPTHYININISETFTESKRARDKEKESKGLKKIIQFSGHITHLNGVPVSLM